MDAEVFQFQQLYDISYVFRKYSLIYYTTCLQHNEILGVIKDNEIDRWQFILKTGRVHRISDFLVGTTTERDRQIVDNNLKLFFTCNTEVLDLLDECNAIPCHHLPPFVPFVDVPSHLQRNAETIGK